MAKCRTSDFPGCIYYVNQDGDDVKTSNIFGGFFSVVKYKPFVDDIFSLDWNIKSFLGHKWSDVCQFSFQSICNCSYMHLIGAILQ